MYRLKRCRNDCTDISLLSSEEKAQKMINNSINAMNFKNKLR